jgi:hypothetical protein
LLLSSWDTSYRLMGPRRLPFIPEMALTKFNFNTVHAIRRIVDVGHPFTCAAEFELQ